MWQRKNFKEGGKTRKHGVYDAISTQRHERSVIREKDPNARWWKGDEEERREITTGKEGIWPTARELKERGSGRSVI